MRVLILSFYFRPDLSAGSFRATALVEELSRRLGAGDAIQVLTTLPNRYSSYRTECPQRENAGNVQIVRTALPAHKSGLLDQSRAFLSFARAVLAATAGQRYDVVFATSSRLMTAALGARVARRCGAPLYLDIRDIFPDTMADVFAGKPQRVVLPLLRLLESRTLRRASRVNLVSPGFLDYFRERRADLDYRLFPNGVDDDFLDRGFEHAPEPGRPPVILYAGNIGQGQGLERIVGAAAEALAGRYRFQIVGDGGMRPKLAREIAARSIDNVSLLDPVPRERLIELYRQADILFLHLNDYPAFRKVLPSKIFEYAATGKPILAGVGGYARRFLAEQVDNAAVFDPCDCDGLLRALATLDPGPTGREAFVAKYRRSVITAQLAEDILRCAGREPA